MGVSLGSDRAIWRRCGAALPTTWIEPVAPTPNGYFVEVDRTPRSAEGAENRDVAVGGRRSSPREWVRAGGGDQPLGHPIVNVGERELRRVLDESVAGSERDEEEAMRIATEEVGRLRRRLRASGF